ncbi:DUF6531 domain-containing protein [Streptomyces sp. NPDC050315]|uniref:DUF6531 domain-containing protein n=1 Tax=Streptomyces sp. NPDC050315 TaxID=3155039 RepID=UPI00343AB461
MGHRPTDWHVLDLEKDPTPGDPERVRKLARELHEFAEDVGTALRQITDMASEDAVLKWSGRSAKKFKEEFDGVPGNLRKLRTSYDMAGDAIADYWPKLERAQSLADRALKKGREARDDLTAAQGRLDSATDWVKTATARTKAYDDAKGPEAPDESKVRAATRNAQQANSARSDAQGAVDSAQSALDAAKALAAEAKELREEAARVCQDKLDEASDAGIQNRHWWEEVAHFVTENWDTIVSVCKVVVAVLGIVVMIVGGPILAAIVVVAALVVLADTLNKYRKGQASLFDIGMAALDCIPGAKGITTLAGAAKGLKAAAKGLRAGGLRNALRSGKDLLKKAKPAKARCKNGDPIDMVSGEMLMEGTDVALPGVLPLVLQRTHLSTYRQGSCFGESWASTLDQRLEFDSQGAVFATEDGMLLAYPRPEAGRPVMPAAGPRWPLEWDGTSNGAITISDPRSGLTRRFAPPPEIPEQRGRAEAPEQVTLLLQSITDRNGNEITFEYNDADLPTAIRHTGGYHIAVDTDDNRVTGLRLLSVDAGPEGTQLLRYAYDSDGNLTEIYHSSGRPLQLTYDENARITSWTDRIGAWYRFTYDTDDRVVRGEGVDSILSCAVMYDTDNRITRYRNSLGHVTTYEYNERLQLTAETDPLGIAVRQEWDEYDRLLSQADALGNTTSYTYDDAGNITRITRADGSIAETTYNDLSLPIESVDADGASWRREYDSCGNLTTLADPAGAVTRYAYTATGHLDTITDALGHTTHIRCNPSGLPMEITDPLGAVTHYEHDAFGRPVSVTNPTGSTTHLEWTIEGRLARRVDSTGAEEKWTYDGEGNCTSHTHPTGDTTRFGYTYFDLLTTRTDSDGSRHAFTHDTELHLTKVTSPQDLTWTYTYDAAGQLAAETDFDGRTTAYVYDGAGRLTRRTNPAGQSVTYHYDSVGRLVEKDVDGRTVAFENDPCGRLIRATAPDATLAYQYDAVGRVIAESIDGRTLATACDAAGRRIRRTTPVGVETAYSYDTVGHCAALAVSGRTFSFEHDAADREILRRLDDQFTLAFAWDPVGHLTQQTLTAQGAEHPSIERTYAYREDGHLTGVSDRHTGHRSFTLDRSGRVTAVQAENWTESYAYDEVGNQTRALWPDKHPGSQAQGTRAYEGTCLTSAGNVRYEYDAAGRVVLRQVKRLSRKPDTWRYTWDAEDRLTSVVTPDGTCWRYLYDPLGRRIAKQRLTTDGAIAEETRFVWDGSTLAEQTTRISSASELVTLTWDHDGQAPLAQTESKSLAEAPQEVIDQRFFAIITDQIGTPTELVDEEGNVAWRTRATLWGVTTWNRDSTAYTPLRFPGQYYDPETGLHHNYFRHYDPQTARYLTLDPLGLTPAPNPAAYVDNPHTLADPLGLAPCNESDVTWGGRVQYGAPGPHDRATGMHATISKDMLGGKTGPQVDPAGWESGKGYNRAHLLAAMLGGSNKDARNFVTMHAYANSPVMRQVELQVRNAVRDGDEIIQYSVTPIYADAHAKIPLGVTIEAHGNKGFQMHPHGSTTGGTNSVTIWNRAR